jgi:DNA-binding response OmpR family regulator
VTRRRTYYIIDDDVDDQNFLIEALTANDRDIQCFTAFEGKRAIRDLSSNKNPLPDAIFLDLNIPKFNGKQCLAEIKRTPSLLHIPIIIYSTTSDKREIGETMKLGAAYFMTKKSSIKELREELAVITAGLNA